MELLYYVAKMLLRVIEKIYKISKQTNNLEIKDGTIFHALTIYKLIDFSQDVIILFTVCSDSICFQRVEQEMLVKNNDLCKDYLIEAMKYHLLSPEHRATMKISRTRPRTPKGMPKVGSFLLKF